METLITIAVFIAVIGFLILIHEGGHFLVARWAKVWVHEFAIGFGPAVWKRKTKETLYALRIFPIGGYVRMAGETVTVAEGGGSDKENAAEDSTAANETDANILTSEAPGQADASAESKDEAAEDEDANVPQDRMFSRKSPWARMAIIFAGPLTNIVGAVLIMILVVATLGAPRVEVRSFSEDNSPASQVLMLGDIILSMNSEAIYSTGQIQSIVGGAGETSIDVEVLRNGSTLTTQVTPEWIEEANTYRIGAGFGTAQTNLINQIPASSPLAKLGVQSGDRIIALGSLPISSSQTLNQAVFEYGEANKPQTISVLRGSETMTFDLVFEADQTVAEIFAGVSLETPTRSLGFVDSIGAGANQTWGMAVALYMGIRSIFQGEVAAGEAFSGPVGIANILSDGLRQGWLLFFYLIAFLSLNLGIINLLPFPALDGSRILFITVELVMGKPIPAKYEGWIHQIGFFILLALIILITFNDIVKLFG